MWRVCVWGGEGSLQILITIQHKAAIASTKWVDSHHSKQNLVSECWVNCLVFLRKLHVICSTTRQRVWFLGSVARVLMFLLHVYTCNKQDNKMLSRAFTLCAFRFIAQMDIKLFTVIVNRECIKQRLFVTFKDCLQVSVTYYCSTTVLLAVWLSIKQLIFVSTHIPIRVISVPLQVLCCAVLRGCTHGVISTHYY